MIQDPTWDGARLNRTLYTVDSGADKYQLLRSDELLCLHYRRKLVFMDALTGLELVTKHFLREAGDYLWMAPRVMDGKDFFYTNRPDLIHVYREYGDGRRELLKPGDPDREAYISRRNRKDLVLSRVSDPERHKQSVDALRQALLAHESGQLSGRMRMLKG